MGISTVTAMQVNAYSSSMALGLLQTGVTSGTASTLLGGSASSSSASSDGVGGMLGGSAGSTGSSAFNIASDTFASVLSSQGEGMVRISLQQATARIKAQATAKIDQAQKSQAAANSVTL